MFGPEYIKALGEHDWPQKRQYLAGPFPNLRCREIIKAAVEAIRDTTTAVAMTPSEARYFALGIARGALVTLLEIGDETSEQFALELLALLNRDGVEAVCKLVFDVSGDDTLCEPSDGERHALFGNADDSPQADVAAA